MKTHIFKKDFWKFSLFTILLLSSIITAPQNIFFNTKVKAQTNITPTNALTISPPSYELTSNPSDQLQNVIKVTNTGNATATFEAIVEDFRVEGDEGIVKVLDTEDNPNSFSKWFTVTPSNFTLAKGETRQVTFTINVPEDAEPGGHFASLLFQPKAIESESGSGAQILQRVGSLILMTVSGDVKEVGKVAKFHTKSYVGNGFDTLVSDTQKDVQYFVPNGEKLNEESPKSYFSQGPVAFELVMANEGNVYYRPEKATVKIFNIFGQQVDEIHVQPKNVFPGGERRTTVIWPAKNLWGIRYRAELSGIYGQKDPKQLTASTSFWAFPLPIAITILVVLVILILLRKRLTKAVSILAKG